MLKETQCNTFFFDLIISNSLNYASPIFTRVKYWCQDKNKGLKTGQIIGDYKIMVSHNPTAMSSKNKH